MPTVSRYTLGLVQIGDGAERIVVLDVVLGLPRCAQFQIKALDALNPHTVAMCDGWLFGRRRLRFEERREFGVRRVGRTLRQLEVPAKICSVAVSGGGQIIGQ